MAVLCADLRHRCSQRWSASRERTRRCYRTLSICYRKIWLKMCLFHRTQPTAPGRTLRSKSVRRFLCFSLPRPPLSPSLRRRPASKRSLPRIAEQRVASQLRRKGFPSGAVKSALEDTRAAAEEVGEHLLPFNEQRRRRAARALDRLLLTLPESEVPAAFVGALPSNSGKVTNHAARFSQPDASFACCPAPRIRISFPPCVFHASSHPDAPQTPLFPMLSAHLAFSAATAHSSSPPRGPRERSRTCCRRAIHRQPSCHQ